MIINQIKFILSQQNGPDRFDLDESKIFTNAAMASYNVAKIETQCNLYHKAYFYITSQTLGHNYNLILLSLRLCCFS